MKDGLPAAGLLVLRLAFGLGLARHGYDKVFAGRAMDLVPELARLGLPLPVVFAWAAALSEFAGGLLLALGLATRAAAAFAAATMATAAFVHHAADPLAAKELALAYLAVSVAVLLTGPGPLSLDRLLGSKQS